jgi:hypothetical protein
LDAALATQPITPVNDRHACLIEKSNESRAADVALDDSLRLQNYLAMVALS